MEYTCTKKDLQHMYHRRKPTIGLASVRETRLDRGFPTMHMYMYMYMEYNYPDLLYMIQKQMTHNTRYNYK